MGNCLNPQKIKSYETSSLMDGDEYKLEILSNKIDDIYIRLEQLNTIIKEHETERSSSIEDISRDINYLNQCIENIKTEYSSTAENDSD